MFPSHATMFWALVDDEAERELREKEYHDVSLLVDSWWIVGWVVGWLVDRLID
jgi:hypothetical protein